MAYELRDGQGSLWKNEDKQAETHADYRGSIRINGQDYWLDAWLKAAKSGKKYMSLSAKPKLARQTAGAVAHKDAAPAFQDDDIDPIPF